MVEAVFSLLGERDSLVLSSFPRDVEKIITFALEIPIRKEPELTLSSARRYLCAIGGDSSTLGNIPNDRKLHGLLHIGSPCTIIFVCASLPLHIQAYILAHELGHILADVFLKQHLWLKSLPEREDAIRRYFNWKDLDPWLELTAFLRGLPLRPQPIVGRGENFAPETTEREIIADLFARELLAPWDRVARSCNLTSKRDFAAILRSQYNLPLKIAASYYDEIKRHFLPNSSLYDRLLTQLVVQPKKDSTEC